jgi:formiminotetrahydrofolate cyclodeaminase
MVSNLSIGKGEFDARYQELCELAEAAQAAKDELVHAIDADTAAFNEVIAAMQMAKDTPEQVAARSRAIQAGYRSAARVPLRTAQLCQDVLKLCRAAANIGNRAVMSDAGVGALMAYAGVRGAIHNVRINLPHTGDEDFVTEMESELATLLSDSGAMCEAIQQQVENSY